LPVGSPRFRGVLLEPGRYCFSSQKYEFQNRIGFNLTSLTLSLAFLKQLSRFGERTVSFHESREHWSNQLSRVTY
jgi:hypothetical protein